MKTQDYNFQLLYANVKLYFTLSRITTFLILRWQGAEYDMLTSERES